MKMIVTTRKHSYLIDDKDLATVELGSFIFAPEENKLYVVLEPGVLTEINSNVIGIDTVEKLITTMSEISGEVNIALNDDIKLESFVSVAGSGSVNMDLNNHNIIRD